MTDRQLRAIGNLIEAFFILAQIVLGLLWLFGAIAWPWYFIVAPTIFLVVFCLLVLILARILRAAIELFRL